MLGKRFSRIQESLERGPGGASSDSPVPTSPVQPAGGLAQERLVEMHQPITPSPLPSTTGESTSGCKACDEKKKAEEAAKNGGVIRP